MFVLKPLNRYLNNDINGNLKHPLSSFQSQFWTTHVDNNRRNVGDTTAMIVLHLWLVCLAAEPLIDDLDTKFPID